MEVIKARVTTPTKEQIKSALKACVDSTYSCSKCYLHPFTNEGRLSTGETCHQHLALDVCAKLDEAEPRPDLSDIAADLMIANAENKQLKDELASAEDYRAGLEAIIEKYKTELTEYRNAKASGRLVILPEPEESGYQGLKVKYRVFRAKDSTPVENCFVLRPDKDSTAVGALYWYATYCDNPLLATDIRKWLAKLAIGRTDEP